MRRNRQKSSGQSYQLKKLHQFGRWAWQHWSGRLVVGLTSLLLGIWAVPYLAPIRAVDLVQQQQALTFSDRTGLPLGTILTRDQEHTVSVELSQISPHFHHAIIAAEDGRFYQHGALDEQAIARSLLEAAQAKQVVSGASTITMQLARMLDPIPRTLPGKLREIWTAWRLTAGMSKDQILQAYINRLPMGGNVYGIEAAARIYFGVPASDLTIGQASLLAGVPNDPNRLNPYTSWLAARDRQIYVLAEMVKDGYLTQAQAEQAENETLTLQPRQQGIIAAPHWLFWLAAQQQSPSSPTQIRTTLDRPLQQFVETQMQQVIGTLANNNVHHGAAVVFDNQTGAALAYVGSPDYFADDQFSRNDGVQALRQPGSTLKPFLYQLALENRQIHPNTILADVPTRYAIPGAKLYIPSDYNEKFQGPVRVRVALANSLNVPAVRVLEQVGVGTFLERLHQLGFTHLNQTADYYGLGLALGSGEVSLWELAQAYLTIARQGEAIAPQVIQAGERRQETGGDRLPPRTPDATSTWQLITDMLNDPQARAKSFGVDSLLKLPFSAAVKTGTSSDFRDTWTVGFSRDYTVGVWVGNFDGSPMRQVSGVTGAAPLWQRIMLHLHENREPEPLPVPQALVKRPICALSGARPTSACPTVVEEYFFPADLAAYAQQSDPFYQTVSKPDGSVRTRLNLPAEYDEWLAMQPDQAGDRPLRIVSPHDQDVFVLDPHQLASKAAQRLEFRLATSPSEPAEWRLNGKLLATQQTPTLVWEPSPGTWNLQVKSGAAIAEVCFEVQTATNKSSRRGFSFSDR